MGSGKENESTTMLSHNQQEAQAKSQNVSVSVWTLLQDGLVPFLIFFAAPRSCLTQISCKYSLAQLPLEK
jgi:hypothetical protein